MCGPFFAASSMIDRSVTIPTVAVVERGLVMIIEPTRASTMIASNRDTGASAGARTNRSLFDSRTSDTFIIDLHQHSACDHGSIFVAAHTPLHAFELTTPPKPQLAVKRPVQPFELHIKLALFRTFGGNVFGARLTVTSGSRPCRPAHLKAMCLLQWLIHN